MKYRCTVEIDLPLEQTVTLWTDEANYKHWQDGFESIKQLSGLPNTEGAKAEIRFGGKRKIVLIETIITANLPNEKKALYEHMHMTNTQRTQFIALDENRTQYISEVDYVKFNGMLIKLLAKLFPGKFKAQSQKWMEQFKVFAEAAEA